MAAHWAYVWCHMAMKPMLGETKMEKFNVFANGVFWGVFEAETADEAIREAADELGTADVGEDHASTEGMTAEPAE